MNNNDNWKQEFDELILNNPMKLKKALHIKNLHLPSSFYKYRCFDENDYWVKWLDGEIYLSSPLHFNDPFDCILSVTKEIYNTKLAKEICLNYLKTKFKLSNIDINRINLSENAIKATFTVLEQHGYKIDRNKEDKDFLEDIIPTQLREVFRVACFSELNDSILMWSHYAKNHSGFCIEYDFTKNNIAEEYLYPVVYSVNRNDFSKYLDNNIKYWSVAASLCKATEWGYEKEWRLLGVDRLLNRNIKYNLKVENSIKAIYLGADIKEDNFNRIKEICKNKKIPIYKMELSKNEYKLIPRNIL